MTRHSSLGLLGALLLFGALLAATVAAASAAPIKATIVDRNGDRHEVTHLTYQQQPELEVYLDDRRELIRFKDLDRIVIGGNVGERTLPVTITLRDGEQRAGTMFAVSGDSPHRYIVSGPTSSVAFSGRTQLGPFAISLRDVRDIRFLHEEAAQERHPVSATIVDTEGQRFEVTALRYRNRSTFAYDQGRNKRIKPLSSISRIEFPEAAAMEEARQVTVTFRSGKVAHGTVDASTVRLPGETDRLYEQRVFEAVTGDAGGAPFAIGLHQLRLIRMEVEETGTAAPGTSTPGTSTTGTSPAGPNP